MEQSLCGGLFFVDTTRGFDWRTPPDSVLHFLCTEGSMSFVFHEVRYNVVPEDYVILPNASLASAFSCSPDFRSIGLCISELFVASLALRSNYGVVGHLSLLQNPVMKLSSADFRRCRDDLVRLRERLEEQGHLFRRELLEHLLMAHILDLYDIHARERGAKPVSERAWQLLQRFIELLYRGEHLCRRDLPYFASLLCVTPHYLSDVSRAVSGRPASYWIDYFTLREVGRLLLRKDMPLAEVAERLHFSSLSYFSRYVQKHFGMSPSAYRRRL